MAGLHLAAVARSADADRVAEWIARADELDVAVQSLTAFAHSESGPAGLVIGFGAIPESRIDEGLRRLRRAVSGG